MKFGIGVLLLVGVVCCADAVRASDRDALQGAWQLSSGVADGKSLTPAELAGGKLVIEGDHYTLTMNNAEPITGTQKLGMSNDLHTIDITFDNGEHKGDTCLGIYETTGDEFRVTFSLPGADRPTSFEPAPRSGQWMHVWKRAN
ncbi:TIGR03067 domain-containing protein [Aeoliella sp. SH292]|uniref:TIGR03067 domain-containing protein n=1 Tax=Aeoliella sp. SH292 TaxID=3454464 RepID=UPI003F9543BC